MVEALAHPSGKFIVLIAAHFQEPPRYGHHLNRVERGDGPLQCFRFANRITRH
jgi:hypothetical protein